RAYGQAGLSILPIRPDGTKQPSIPSWKPYQTEQATEDQLNSWYGGVTPPGIAVIAGGISGNLEVLDFDHDADTVFPAFEEQVPPELWEKLTVHQTPSGGYHLFYRLEGVVGSGKPVAMPTEGTKPIIETRGRGNYILVPGSPPECHESGREYVHLEGPELVNVQTIGFEDWAYLRALAKSYDQRIAREVKPVTTTKTDSSWEIRPGDAFNAKDDEWEALLESEEVGFSLYQETSQFKLYTRPGKEVSKGCSASLGYCRTENDYRKLKVFSSSTKLDTDKTYDRFAFYTYWFHDGDFQAATMALYEKGYGKKREEQGADFEFTDAGNAAFVAEKFGNLIRYAVDESTWYAWDGKRWEKGADVQIKALFVKAMAEWKEEAACRLQAITDKEKRRFSPWNRVLHHATSCRNTARVNAGVAAMALLPQLQCR
ncbi:MAG: bifunctional DNA primase/polymerase, partial [Gemmataceae bacterium]